MRGSSACVYAMTSGSSGMTSVYARNCRTLRRHFILPVLSSSPSYRRDRSALVLSSPIGDKRDANWSIERISESSRSSTAWPFS